MAFDPHHFYDSAYSYRSNNGQIIQKKPVVRTPIYSSRDLPGLLSAVQAFGYNPIPNSTPIPNPFHSKVGNHSFVLVLDPDPGDSIRLIDVYSYDFFEGIRPLFDDFFTEDLDHPIIDSVQISFNLKVFCSSFTFPGHSDNDYFHFKIGSSSGILSSTQSDNGSRFTVIPYNPNFMCYYSNISPMFSFISNPTSSSSGNILDYNYLGSYTDYLSFLNNGRFTFDKLCTLRVDGSQVISGFNLSYQVAVYLTYSSSIS